ncbi:MAG: hypothetical protein AAGF94_01665, partial [Pseudomonadota bacterium]
TSSCLRISFDPQAISGGILRRPPRPIPGSNVADYCAAILISTMPTARLYEPDLVTDFGRQA